LQSAPPRDAVLLILGIGLVLSELGLLHVEFRRHAYTYSLAGLPLAIGLA
jgi:hypothetical protein